MSVAHRIWWSEVVVAGGSGCPIPPMHGTLAPMAANSHRRFVCGCYEDNQWTEIEVRPEREKALIEARAYLDRCRKIAEGWTPPDATIEELEHLRLQDIGDAVNYRGLRIERAEGIRTSDTQQRQ